MQPKPIKDVVTFDGKTHEVDMRLVGKVYTAWGFVDKELIEGAKAKTALLAVNSWKKQYRERFEAAKAQPAAGS